MGEITADADALLMCLRRRPGRAGIAVTEGETVMHIVDDRLHPCPARRKLAEQLPGQSAEVICLAVTAAEEIAEHLVRQFRYRHLPGLPVDLVPLAAVL